MGDFLSTLLGSDELEYGDDSVEFQPQVDKETSSYVSVISKSTIQSKPTRPRSRKDSHVDRNARHGAAASVVSSIPRPEADNALKRQGRRVFVDRKSGNFVEFISSIPDKTNQSQVSEKIENNQDLEMDVLFGNLSELQNQGRPLSDFASIIDEFSPGDRTPTTILFHSDPPDASSLGFGISMPVRKPPPKPVPKKPKVIFVEGKMQRVYGNRCERYCLGPISIVVDTLGTILLGILNALLLCAAIMTVTAGVVFIKKIGPYNEFMERLERNFNNSLVSLGLGSAAKQGQLEGYVQNIAYPLIIFGITISLMAIVGLIGTCGQSRCLLDVYTKVCALLLLFEFCLFLYIYDGEPTAGKDYLYESLNDYTGAEGTDAITMIWNQAMNYFNCCGVENHLDFMNLEKWPPAEIQGKPYVLETPVFCCKEKSKDFTCALKGVANSTNNNMNTGCYEVIYTFAFMNDYTISAFAVMITTQIIVLFFSSWLLWSSGIQVAPEMIKQQRKTDV